MRGGKTDRANREPRTVSKCRSRRSFVFWCSSSYAVTKVLESTKNSL
jgi:hypothetical protein